MRHIYIYDYIGTFNKDLDKMLYLGNRRFLRSDDDMRCDTVNFPDKSIEKQLKPKIRDYYEMKSLHSAYECVSAK